MPLFSGQPKIGHKKAEYSSGHEHKSKDRFIETTIGQHQSIYHQTLEQTCKQKDGQYGILKIAQLFRSCECQNKILQLLLAYEC